MRAAYVWRMPGLSCVGIQVRVKIGSPCEYKYGRFPPAVPADYTETYAVILPDNWVTCLPK